MAFDNGVVVKIEASTDLELMTVSLVMPPSLKTKVDGLMGNYDDDSANDIRAYNGTELSSSASEEDIYPVALTWITNSSTSLFSYRKLTEDLVALASIRS